MYIATRRACLEAREAGFLVLIRLDSQFSSSLKCTIVLFVALNNLDDYPALIIQKIFRISAT